MDLLSTILELRQMRFPNLPEDLVKEIVSIETDYAEDRAEGFKRVNQALERYLNSSAGNDPC
jgi:hypothetical protein